jgi:hypothetical protein
MKWQLINGAYFKSTSAWISYWRMVREHAPRNQNDWSTHYLNCMCVFSLSSFIKNWKRCMSCWFILLKKLGESHAWRWSEKETWLYFFPTPESKECIRDLPFIETKNNSSILVCLTVVIAFLFYSHFSNYCMK